MKLRRVLVTGSYGFLGKYIVDFLIKNKISNYILPPKDKLDLLSFYNVRYALVNLKPDYVIHAAGWNGGIEWNRLYPGEVFFKNTIMGMNVLEAARVAGVKKVLSLVTSCSYPDMDVLKEENFLSGPPNDTVSCHGYAKRNIQIMSYMYNKQYGMQAVTVCPNTLFGPGDTQDPNKSKVMTALIKKFKDAKENNEQTVTCWGTGKPVREFIYVEDAAELVVKSLEKYDDCTKPLNLGSGKGITIKDLAETIANKIGYKGKILWDISRPDGQIKKVLDTSRMCKYLGHYKFVTLEEGLQKTI